MDGLNVIQIQPTSETRIRWPSNVQGETNRTEVPLCCMVGVRIFSSEILHCRCPSHRVVTYGIFSLCNSVVSIYLAFEYVSQDSANQQDDKDEEQSYEILQ